MPFSDAGLLMLTLNLAQPPETRPDTRPVPATGFLFKTLELEGETYAYSVYVPPEYTADRAWPVILFLHGAGERGRDGLLQTDTGIGRAIRRHREWIPAVVVMPQCREHEAWTGRMATLALRCLEQTSREYRLDATRMYLTGLSLGGHGTWHLAASLPGRFAAIVPICGFAEWQTSTGAARELAPRLKGTPIWTFHGVKDEAVAVEKTREIVAALRDIDAPVEYTEDPEGTHNVWDQAYGNAALWKWMFEQRLARPSHPVENADRLGADPPSR